MTPLKHQMSLVRSHSPCEFMHDLYIAEIYIPETILLLLIVWVYLHSLIHSDLWKKVA